MFAEQVEQNLGVCDVNKIMNGVNGVKYMV